MNLKYAPISAALLFIAMSVTVAPTMAQLPPTNMGKFIHQPGDNQYQPSAQMERHGTDYIDRTGTGAPVMVTRGGGGGGGNIAASSASSITVVNPMILMGSTAPKIDISIEPISADEPIPPGGFPPLPERLNLPVQTSMNFTGRGGGSRGGGGGNGAPQVLGVHEHYSHVAPGAFKQAESGGGDGGGGNYQPPNEEAVPGSRGGGGGGGSSGGGGGGGGSAEPINNGPSRGYYKCGSAAPIMREVKAAPSSAGGGGGETFSSNSDGTPAPKYKGASSSDLKALGRAPKLDDAQDKQAPPEAPQAAIVNQSTTQDLSLPDDEFVSRYGLKDSAGKRMGKYMGRQVTRTIQRGINRGTSLVGF